MYNKIKINVLLDIIMYYKIIRILIMHTVSCKICTCIFIIYNCMLL